MKTKFTLDKKGEPPDKKEHNKSSHVTTFLIKNLDR